MIFFHRSLNDSKSLQIFRTLVNILAYLNNHVVLMVYICTCISKFSDQLTDPKLWSIESPFWLHSDFPRPWEIFLVRKVWLLPTSHSCSRIIFQFCHDRNICLSILFLLLSPYCRLEEQNPPEHMFFFFIFYLISTKLQPSWLGQQSTRTVSRQRDKTPQQRLSWIGQ